MLNLFPKLKLDDVPNMGFLLDFVTKTKAQFLLNFGNVIEREFW